MKKVVIALAALLWSAAAHASCTLGALPFTLSNNTLADASQVMANFNQIVNSGAINCASSGANNDITSLNALITPLTPAQAGGNVFIGCGTGGTANAQTLAVSGPFSLTTGVTVIGTVSGGLTNTTSTTLQVNGGAALNVARSTQLGISTLVGGELTATNMFAATYNGSEWVLQGRFDIVGEMKSYVAGVVPNGWIIADGSTMSCSGNTTTLCGIIGTTYGGTGVLPDTRGRSITGLDNYGTSIGAANRLTNAGTGCGSNFTFLGASCSNGSQSHTQQVAELAAHTHGNTLSDPGHSHQLPSTTGGGAGFSGVVGASGFAGIFSQTVGTGITINNASQGSSQPMPIVNPNFGTFMIIKL